MTQLELIKSVYRDLNLVLEDLDNVNNENKDFILKEIGILLLTYKIINGVLNLSNSELLKVKKEIFKIIDNLFYDDILKNIEMINSSLELTSDKLEQYYSEKLNTDVINVKFRNKDFKERHIKNSNEVKNRLKNTIFKFIKGGIKIGLIKSSVDKIYKMHRYNIDRLIKTENNRVLNKLFLELNKDKRFKYCSVLEKNTCADCKSLDGQIFTYEEALDLIPQHSNCLCYWEVLDNKLFNNFDDSDIIKVRREYIKSGNQFLKIKDGKQGKHIIGHNNYIEGRSYLTISLEEAQVLVNKYSGTGIFELSRNGYIKDKELIISDQIIGVNINNRTGERTETNRFYIHYSKDGTHIVPTLKGSENN